VTINGGGKSGKLVETAWWGSATKARFQEPANPPTSGRNLAQANYQKNLWCPLQRGFLFLDGFRVIP